MVCGYFLLRAKKAVGIAAGVAGRASDVVPTAYEGQERNPTVNDRMQLQDNSVQSFSLLLKFKFLFLSPNGEGVRKDERGREGARKGG